jgi:L-asparaginase / beta-aspartyl-peptidase
VRPIIIAHAGVGTPRSEDDGPRFACEKAFPLLVTTVKDRFPNAVNAAVEAVAAMESDVRFDAGVGSFMRLDGGIEMDAAVMDSAENIGAVIGLKDTKNPIYVAREVLELPHNILSGQGALAFARQMGFEAYDCTTPRAYERLASVRASLKGHTQLPQWALEWKDFKKKGYLDAYLEDLTGDTVGAVARDAKGNFASAVSTGGISIQLPGRVGDCSIIGAGVYCSKKGAVCATGIGEHIQRKVLAKAVYDLIDQGESAQDACDWGMGQFEKKVPVGVIAVSKDGYGIASNEDMAQFVKEV